MNPFILNQQRVTRRQFFGKSAAGLGGVAARDEAVGAHAAEQVSAQLQQELMKQDGTGIGGGQGKQIQHKYQKQFDTIKLVSFDSARNCKRFERYEIQRLKPEFNGNAKGDFIEPQLKCNKGKNIISMEEKIKLMTGLNRN